MPPQTNMLPVKRYCGDLNHKIIVPLQGIIDRIHNGDIDDNRNETALIVVHQCITNLYRNRYTYVRYSRSFLIIIATLDQSGVRYGEL
jgi:hypothetical protein